jgi:hypothetical protein
MITPSRRSRWTFDIVVIALCRSERVVSSTVHSTKYLIAARIHAVLVTKSEGLCSRFRIVKKAVRARSEVHHKLRSLGDVVRAEPSPRLKHGHGHCKRRRAGGFRRREFAIRRSAGSFAGADEFRELFARLKCAETPGACEFALSTWCELSHLLHHLAVSRVGIEFA